MIKLKDSLQTRLKEDFFYNVIYVCINRMHLLFGIRGPAQIEELPFKYYNPKDLESDLEMVEKFIDTPSGKINGFVPPS